MSNKELWDRVKVTDPLAVKPITGKSYKGNSPKPYWLIERATEEFGPIGIGWGVIVKSERFERLGEHDVLHVATVAIWYVKDGKRSETFEQMGGTKAAYMSSKGVLIVDEDAGKKSVTDAMVKCLSMLGFAGDIFSGQWDDSKYIEFANEYHRKREDPDAEAREARMTELEEFALYLIDCHRNGNDLEAIEAWYDPASWSSDNPTETEERMHVWRLLKEESKLRSTIKANKPQPEQQKAA